MHQLIVNIRKLAIEEFINTTTDMTKYKWIGLHWDQQKVQPEFKSLGLISLNPVWRFPGTEFETLFFSFRNTKEGKIFDIEVKINIDKLWVGSGKDGNEAAREAITTLLEFAYLQKMDHKGHQ